MRHLTIGAAAIALAVAISSWSSIEGGSATASIFAPKLEVAELHATQSRIIARQARVEELADQAARTENAEKFFGLLVTLRAKKTLSLDH